MCFRLSCRCVARHQRTELFSWIISELFYWILHPFPFAVCLLTPSKHFTKKKHLVNTENIPSGMFFYSRKLQCSQSNTSAKHTPVSHWFHSTLTKFSRHHKHFPLSLIVNTLLRDFAQWSSNYLFVKCFIIKLILFICFLPCIPWPESWCQAFPFVYNVLFVRMQNMSKFQFESRLRKCVCQSNAV